jgi:hypothetical protein
MVRSPGEEKVAFRQNLLKDVIVSARGSDLAVVAGHRSGPSRRGTVSRRPPLSQEAIEELLASCRAEAQEIVRRHELWPDESVRVVSDAMVVTVAQGGPVERLKERFLEAIEEGCRRAVAERDLDEEVESDTTH